MGRIEQTVSMKTTFIFLACMLGIATADFYDANRAKSLQKDCNSKAEEISSQDCKQDCKEQCLDSDPDSPDDPCKPCIMNHKGYGLACLIFLPCLGKCPTFSTWSGLGQILTTQILE